MIKVIGWSCLNCGREFENPSNITDPDSNHFDELCCPYCDSISISAECVKYKEFATVELPYTFENGYLEVTKNFVEYGFQCAELIEDDPIPF